MNKGSQSLDIIMTIIQVYISLELELQTYLAIKRGPKLTLSHSRISEKKNTPMTVTVVFTRAILCSRWFKNELKVENQDLIMTCVLIIDKFLFN